MISFKGQEREKVSVICGGEYNDKFVYITEEKPEPARNLDEEDVYDLLDDEDFNMNRFKRFPIKDRLKLIKALKQGQEPLDEYLVDKYKNMSEKVNDKLKKELVLESGVMIAIPSDNERVFVAGKSGSGKSFWAALYAKEYKTKFPKRKVIIFTKHKKEKAYKIVPHKEVIVTENELVQEPIDITLLKDTLIIFDDCENLQDKKIGKNMRSLNTDLLTSGRKYNISVITLQHQLMEYKETRNLLNEANKVIFFNSGSAYHITRYLKVYAGLDPATIKKIIALKSRWTMISLSIPTYILHEHGLFII